MKRRCARGSPLRVIAWVAAALLVSCRGGTGQVNDRRLVPATQDAGRVPAAGPGAPGWGQVVGGLRMRLTADRTRVSAGQPMRLTVEWMNVGDERLTVVVPTPLPLVSEPGNHPYGADHGRSLVVTVEQTAGQRLQVQWASQQLKPLVEELCVLRPGQTLSLLILLSKADAPETMTRAAAQLLSPPTRTARARFFYADSPGSYRLTASYAPARPDAWSGKLTSMPVEIEVVPAAARER